MTNGWQTVPLGEFLTQRKEFFTIDDFSKYKRARVQSHGKGIVLRDEVDGTEIKTKKQQAAQTGEFLVAEIDAKVGGFGIVPPELDGAVVSSHYFLFQINEKKCLKNWLNWFVRHNSLEEQVKAQGSTNYAAIRPSHVLNFQIPLPPLDMQHRIVEHVQILSSAIAKAQFLREEINAETELLPAAELKKLRNELLDSKFTKNKLGDITRVTAGGTPSRDNSSYWNGNIPWIRTGELVDGDIYTSGEHITEEGMKNSSAKLFPKETILIALYGQGQTRGRTGRLMIEATTNQACCAILPTPDLLEPRFTQYWLRSLYYEMREQNHGGAQPNWNGAMIKNIEISIPPLDEQRRIVAYLDSVQARLASLRELQSATGEELSALLPSVLDRAFRGEL